MSQQVRGKKWTSLKGIKTKVKNEKEALDSEKTEIREEKISW